MKINRLLFCVGIFFTGNSISQVGIGTITPHASAELDVTSTSKGLLPPRMTQAQRNAIAIPVAAGLQVWCTDCGTSGEMQVYNGTTWTNMVGATAAAPVCSANVGGTTKTFMCYNLGVTGTQDPFTYQSGNNNGALYQWGRKTDGHEVRTSTPQAGPVAVPVANRFITNSAAPNDWINPQNNSLWLDASKTANDSCPAGFRVPTQAQWGGLFRDGTTIGEPASATRNTWAWTGNGYTVGANLYLPAAGKRDVSDAALSGLGTGGYYWSSTVNGTSAYYLSFDSFFVNPGNYYGRGRGLSVRCISE